MDAEFGEIREFDEIGPPSTILRASRATSPPPPFISLVWVMARWGRIFYKASNLEVFRHVGGCFGPLGSMVDMRGSRGGGLVDRSSPGLAWYTVGVARPAGACRCPHSAASLASQAPASGRIEGWCPAGWAVLAVGPWVHASGSWSSGACGVGGGRVGDGERGVGGMKLPPLGRRWGRCSTGFAGSAWALWPRGPCGRPWCSRERWCHGADLVACGARREATR